MRSPNVDCQRCVNLYPQVNAAGHGKEAEVASFVSTPGLRALATLGSGPVRGAYTAKNGVLFVVGGAKVYRVDPDWSATELGTIGSVAGPVSMVDNGTHLVIVDGSVTGYVVTLATYAFQAIADTDFLGANQVAYQDGYFIFNKPGSGQFYISGLNSVDFDALDFASSEGSPDDVVGLISAQRDLWIFNTETTEVFFNSGNADFPFERVQGAFIEIGCAARFSIAKMGNVVFWLGRDERGAGIVYRAAGYSPQRISTHAVEQAIQRYSDVSDARSYTYQEDGHQFYVLNFPSANTTWVFDDTTGQWHERSYTNDGIYERHRGDCHTFAYGRHVVGDYASPKLYELTPEALDDDGAPIARIRVAPHVSSMLNRVTYGAFQLDIEAGVGIDGLGQGIDPQVMLTYSDDGGHTWSNEKWKSFGKIGNRHKRPLWTRLGASRDRVFKVVITDPVKVTIMGAVLTLEQAAG